MQPELAPWLARQQIEPVAIYQCFHKPYPRAQAAWIKPLALGRYQEEGMLSSASGQSIAELNPFFNEITGYYWIWKNTKDPIVGLYHYRRVLAFKCDNTWADPFGFNMEISDFVLNYFASDEQLACLHRLLSCSDIVIPRLTVTKGPTAEQYRKVHDAESWEAFEKAIADHLPHLMPYMALFEGTNLVTAFNMMVTRREIFNRYCEDLFKILDVVFEKVGPRVHFYQRRYPGFLAERFLLMWLRHERLRVAEVPMILLDDGEVPPEKRVFLS